MLIDTITLQLSNNTERWKENGQMILHDRFFMIRNFGFARKDFLRPSQPYRLQEGRVVIVKRGSADYTFNLVDCHFEAGDVVVFMSDTLIEKHHHSPDFEVDSLSFDYDNPSLPRTGKGFLCMHLDQKTEPIVSGHFDMLWSMAQETPLPTENIDRLLGSLLVFVDRTSRQSMPRAVSRSEETLRRFITLVSQHAARERCIAFYADRLCMAPHYLSTLIKSVSGRTVMQWVNQTAIKDAKVWLAYSDETIAQISDRLHFPCPASFTKFFKRETGTPPIEYRNSVHAQ